MDFSMAELAGNFPVLPTPFTRAGGVDASALKRAVAFCLSGGVSGLVFPGVASEFDYLDAEERRGLTRAVADAAGGRVPLVCGASAATAAEAAGFARDGAACGASAAMIMAPKSIGTEPAAVAAFYREVAERAPGIAIVMQNAPAPVGSGLTPETILAVSAGCPAIRWVKEETLPPGPRISALVDGKPSSVAGIMGGGGARFVIDELNRGACGAMPAAEFADIHSRMLTAHREGRIADARNLYERTLPLLLIQMHYRMRFTKYVLMRRGIFENDAVRAPIPEMDDWDRREIDALLARIADLLDAAPLRTTREAAE
jgi:4-hydroxy-tetrahydrodipicolinate synthase